MSRLLALVLIAACLSPTPAQASDSATTASATPAASVRTDLSGHRYRLPSTDGVYLVDPEGYARGFPDWTTYSNFYADTSGVEASNVLSGISRRADFTRGAYLMTIPDESGVYVVSDGMRRGIASWPVLEKYGFSETKFRSTTREYANTIPEGPVWR